MGYIIIGCLILLIVVSILEKRQQAKIRKQRLHDERLAKLKGEEIDD